MVDYPWETNAKFGTTEILAAAGAIIAAFNLCEIVLLGLMIEIVGDNPKIGRKAFALMGNVSRIDLLNEAASVRVDAETAKHIKRFSTHFSICLENRNLIAHAVIRPNLHNEGDTDFILMKFIKQSSNLVNVFGADKDKLRSIAESCHQTYEYGIHICAYLMGKSNNSSFGSIGKLLSLPEMPIPPSKLDALLRINQ